MRFFPSFLLLRVGFFLLLLLGFFYSSLPRCTRSRIRFPHTLEPLTHSFTHFAYIGRIRAEPKSRKHAVVKNHAQNHTQHKMYTKYLICIRGRFEYDIDLYIFSLADRHCSRRHSKNDFYSCFSYFLGLCIWSANTTQENTYNNIQLYTRTHKTREKWSSLTLVEATPSANQRTNILLPLMLGGFPSHDQKSSRLQPKAHALCRL